MDRSRRSRVSHRTRKSVSTMQAVLVTVRLRDGLPRLRRRREYRVIERSLHRGKNRFGFRLLHFAVLSNHMHFVAQAENRRALSRGMQGLSIRIAKGLNRLWRRKGKVFADRYHDRILVWGHQIKNAIRYVLQNARKHGIRIPRGVPDPFSSAPWFTGWIERPGRTFTDRSPPILPPIDLVWSMCSEMHLSLDELPGSYPIFP